VRGPPRRPKYSATTSPHPPFQNLCQRQNRVHKSYAGPTKRRQVRKPLPPLLHPTRLHKSCSGPLRSVAYTQTATEARSLRTSWTQVPRPLLHDTGTDMPVVQTKTVESQAGCYFDNELIPPGAPRPKLPWAYTYAMFDQLLQAYPEVYLEDFVTFGILQEQPRRRSAREWGEVAGVLANLIGGRQPLVTELMTIIQDRTSRSYRPYEGNGRSSPRGGATT